MQDSAPHVPANAVAPKTFEAHALTSWPGRKQSWDITQQPSAGSKHWTQGGRFKSQMTGKPFSVACHFCFSWTGWPEFLYPEDLFLASFIPQGPIFSRDSNDQCWLHTCFFSALLRHRVRKSPRAICWPPSEPAGHLPSTLGQIWTVQSL